MAEEKMEVTKDTVNEIVREETVKWLAGIWRDQRPQIEYTLDEGLDPEIYMPKRVHDTDAGADLRTIHDVVVPAHGSEIAYTGVHIKLPKGTCGLMVSRSGLNINHAITSTGLIDEGFTGDIRVRLHNSSDSDFKFKAGERVTQIAVLPVLYPTYVYVDALEKSDDENARNDSGHGSSGLQ